MTTPKLQLAETANGQANYLLVNQALAALDQLVMPRVIDKDLSSPPGSPANGAMYIVGSSPTGDWSGQSGSLAWWLSAVGAWTFLTAGPGLSVRVLDELDAFGAPKVYVRTASTWVIPDTGTATAAPAEVVVDATTSRVLSLTDGGKYLRFTDSGTKTVTVAPQADEAWSADTEIHVRNAGAGNLTLVGGTGVTLTAPYSGSLIVPDAGTVTIKRTASDSWDVMGVTLAP